MEKNILKNIIKESENVYQKQLDAITSYMKEHPSVFLDTIKYDEEYLEYVLCDENGKYRDYETLKNYREVSFYVFEELRQVQAIGMVADNELKNIEVWFMYDEQILSIPLNDILKKDYYDLLWLLNNGKDYVFENDF